MGDAESPPPCGSLATSPHMATEAELRTVAAFTNSVSLSGEQKERVMRLWLDAPSDERRQIAYLYSNLFKDSVFVQRLQSRITLVENARRRGPGKTNRSGEDAAGHDPLLLGRIETLIKAVDNAVARLSGPGPFSIEFGIVDTEALNTEVIALMSNQFVQPDAAELGKLVTTPRRHSTRSRRSVTGNFTWFIRSVNNGEIACAAVCHVHVFTTVSFIEVPLFATRSGYHRMGLARILVAALKDHCERQGIGYVLVSADQKAVPFWTTLDFKVLDAKLRARIEFEYKEQCQEFTGAALMAWDPKSVDRTGGRATNSRLDKTTAKQGDEADVEAARHGDELLTRQALERTERFVVRGPLRLPLLGARAVE